MKEVKILIHIKALYANAVHNSIIHNHQKLKRKLFIHWEMDKDRLYPQNGLLLCSKKEQTTYTLITVDESQSIILSEKSQIDTANPFVKWNVG